MNHNFFSFLLYCNVIMLYMFNIILAYKLHNNKKLIGILRDN